VFWIYINVLCWSVVLVRSVIQDGFTSVAPSAPGGAFYTGFTISETEVVTPGTAEISNIIELGGGISVLFTEPQ
jgi:hypothetical protein